MALTIRIPKTDPGLSRRDARERAQEIAEARGYGADVLRRSLSRIERVDGKVPFEYVIEFPDATR